MQPVEGSFECPRGAQEEETAAKSLATQAGILVAGPDCTYGFTYTIHDYAMTIPYPSQAHSGEGLGIVLEDSVHNSDSHATCGDAGVLSSPSAMPQGHAPGPCTPSLVHTCPCALHSPEGLQTPLDSWLQAALAGELTKTTTDTEVPFSCEGLYWPGAGGAVMLVVWCTRTQHQGAAPMHG